jgi:hypothetical protein
MKNMPKLDVSINILMKKHQGLTYIENPASQNENMDKMASPPLVKVAETKVTKKRYHSF